MEQESKLNIGILGGGPAGAMAAYFLQSSSNVTLIDYSGILRTILPTGGGRCNLAYSEYDFKELAKNYPRGEKFLYSVFARYSTFDTLSTFEDLGIKTYVQGDNRIFPESNSAKDVRSKIINELKKVEIKKEKGLRIEPYENKIKLITDMNSYYFDKLIIAIGGHSSFDLISRLGIDIVPPIPALVGLVTSQNLSQLAGVSLQNVASEGVLGDMLFTHKGISGPLIYKISSLKARDKRPYSLSIDLLHKGINLQELLNTNPHKQINNLLSELFPLKLANYILDSLNIDNTLKSHKINGIQRDDILNRIHNFTLTIKDINKDGEVVTAGGVNLNEIDSKTMESKKIKNLYFIGEVIDVDGFCGGFNLQNCWSTAFVAANAIENSNVG